MFKKKKTKNIPSWKYDIQINICSNSVFGIMNALKAIIGWILYHGKNAINDNIGRSFVRPIWWYSINNSNNKVIK